MTPLIREVEIYISSSQILHMIQPLHSVMDIFTDYHYAPFSLPGPAIIRQP